MLESVFSILVWLPDASISNKCRVSGAAGSMLPDDHDSQPESQEIPSLCKVIPLRGAAALRYRAPAHVLSSAWMLLTPTLYNQACVTCFYRLSEKPVDKTRAQAALSPVLNNYM